LLLFLFHATTGKAKGENLRGERLLFHIRVVKVADGSIQMIWDAAEAPCAKIETADIATLHKLKKAN
jgi:hypothetical protein